MIIHLVSFHFYDYYTIEVDRVRAVVLQFNYELGSSMSYTYLLRDTAPHVDRYYAYKGIKMDIKQWKQKNNRAKGYTHFDERVNVQKVWSYISSPSKVAKHGFYPLIHTQIVFNKYKNGYGVKPKTRDIAYSAHIDRLILSYYAYQLNHLYNEHAISIGINKNAIAYRDILGKSNIEFSKDAFDFLKSCNQATVMVGDFTDFFGSLEHTYLKSQMLKLLNVDRLSDDWYSIYKYVTNYVWWELESLLKIGGFKNNEKGIKSFNAQKRAISLSDFKKYKKSKEYKKSNWYKNETGKGIPQGTAISALLSNVYMMDFDVEISRLVDSIGGFYNRYSDDFIIILPNIDGKEFEEIYQSIATIIATIPKLDLQKDKTQIYEYDGTNLTNINDVVFEQGKKNKDVLDYLGFIFDGKNVRFRDKTLTKYYYRMYRKTKAIIRRNGYTKHGNRISNTELYKRFSIRGVQGKYKYSEEDSEGIRNFLTYILRAEKVYYDEEAILKFRKRHMSKIRKELKKINYKKPKYIKVLK